MNRNQYNLYICNISNRTNEDRLKSYFAQFGHIESFTFFKKTLQRHTPTALITYGLSVDINEIIKRNQRLNFDGCDLYLRRTLPIDRPAYERFMSSNELLVSLEKISSDEEFNEINIRKYFSKYGSIVSCRMLIKFTTYLIDFVDTNTVDSIILDEPHFYNENQLIFRKYVTPDRLRFFRIKDIVFQQNKFSLNEKVRRLNHIIEALEFGQIIQLKLIKCSYEEKQMKFNQNKNRDSVNQLNKMCYDFKDKISSIKEILDENQRKKKDIIHEYRNKIENELNRMKELKNAIDLLSFYS